MAKKEFFEGTHWLVEEAEGYWIPEITNKTVVKIPKCLYCGTKFGTAALKYKYCPECGKAVGKRQKGEEWLTDDKAATVYKELKTWANKWGIEYTEEKLGDTLYLNFKGGIYLNAVYGEGEIYFAYNLKDHTSKWAGGNE